MTSPICIKDRNRTRNRKTDAFVTTVLYRTYFAKEVDLEAESGLDVVEGFFVTGGGLLLLGVSFPARDGGSLANWSCRALICNDIG